MASTTRRRVRAVLLSGLLWPGSGQISNGDRVKGVIIGAVTLVLGLAIAVVIALIVLAGLQTDADALDIGLVQQRVHETMVGSSGKLTVLVVLLVLVWVYAIVDAWLGVRDEAGR